MKEREKNSQDTFKCDHCGKIVEREKIVVTEAPDNICLCDRCAKFKGTSITNVKAEKAKDRFVEWVNDNNWMCGYEGDNDEDD